MNNYQKLDSVEAHYSFLVEFGYFHDSLIKELHIVNRSFIDESRNLAGDDMFDLHVIIQNPCGQHVEMIFIEVFSLSLCHAGLIDFDHAELNVRSGAVELRIGHALRIDCTSIYYRHRREAGQPAVLGFEIPRPDCVRATVIDCDLRQCGACNSVFRAYASAPFLYCPGCHGLTVAPEEEGSADNTPGGGS